MVLDFLADLGEVIEEHLSSPGIAFLIVLLAWIHHGLAATITTLLVASAYVRAKYGEEVEEGRRERGDLAILVGIILVVVGAYWAFQEYLPKVTWPVAALILGAILIALGLMERREGTS